MAPGVAHLQEPLVCRCDAAVVKGGGHLARSKHKAQQSVCVALDETRRAVVDAAKGIRGCKQEMAVLIAHQPIPEPSQIN